MHDRGPDDVLRAKTTAIVARYLEGQAALRPAVRLLPPDGYSVWRHDEIMARIVDDLVCRLAPDEVDAEAIVDSFTLALNLADWRAPAKTYGFPYSGPGTRASGAAITPRPAEPRGRGRPTRRTPRSAPEEDPPIPVPTAQPADAIEPGYADALDPATQLEVEERIAATIFAADDQTRLSEHTCADLGRELLRQILAQFRPDLMEPE